MVIFSVSLHPFASMIVNEWAPELRLEMVITSPTRVRPAAACGAAPSILIVCGKMPYGVQSNINGICSFHRQYIDRSIVTLMAGVGSSVMVTSNRAETQPLASCA